MFDAGAIVASLDLKDDAFRSKLERDRAEARDFERHPYRVRLDATFDTASVTRARQMFATLDNILSRDAAGRLRNSPQGSVLGALNSLFSPHPVAGAPTPSQAASQGLLGRIARPGGGGDGGFVSAAMLARFFHGGGSGAGGVAGGIAGGIGPSILGIAARPLLMGTAGAVGLGALPALLGPLGALGVAGAGLLTGKLGIGAIDQTVGPLVQQSQQIQQQLMFATGTQRQQLLQQQAQIAKTVQGLSPAFRSIYNSMSGIQNQWQQIGQNIAPAFARPLATVARLIVSLTPLIDRTFGAGARLLTPFAQGLGDVARMVLPLLIQGFRLVQPVIRPLIDGFGRLVAGILPGLNALIRASLPIIRPFAGILAGLGHDIGGLFAAMAPAVRASLPVFRAIMSVIGALFPIVGQLATVFARVLGPVFTQLARTITLLLPILRPLGDMLAHLAAAVLADLGSALIAVLRLISGMQPAIRILAGALSQMFGILENSGVFAILGSSLEKIAPLLAQMVNQLVRGFAPILPVLIQLMSQFSGIMIGLMSAGLTTILRLITGLLTAFPVLSKILLVAAAAWGVLTLAMSVNPVVAIAAAILALIGVITLLVTHWSQVWGGIKRVAEDAWRFIYDGWGKYLLPLLGPAGLIALGAIELYQHWNTIWGGIRRVAQDFYTWIWTDFGQKIYSFLTQTMPGWFRTAVKAVGDAWNAVETAVKAPVNWVIRYVINDGLIKAFDWISSKVGGPHIPDVPLLARGGRIPGYGGGDRHPALLEAGETVIPKEESRHLAWLWKLLGIPGYQAGGRVPFGASRTTPGGAGAGGLGNPFGKLFDLGRILAAITTGNGTALANAFTALMGHGVGGAIGDLAQLLIDIPKTLVGDAVHWLIRQFTSAGGPVGSGAGRIASSGLIRTEQLFAMDRFPLYGWPLSMMGALVNLWNRESGWNPWAVNASSGAAGIAQSLGHGLVRLGDWMGQIIWGENYIRARYGNPAVAWAHEEAAGWYDRGGWMPPGPSLAVNATRQREAVLTPAQSQAFVNLGEAARLFTRGLGTASGSALMRDVYLTLPEGSTVAQALAEITFMLRSAEMAGYAGVTP